MAQGSHYHQLRLAEKAAELKPEDEGGMGCPAKLWRGQTCAKMAKERYSFFFVGRCTMMEHGIRLCEWIQMEQRWGVGVRFKDVIYYIFSLWQAKVSEA